MWPPLSALDPAFRGPCNRVRKRADTHTSDVMRSRQYCRAPYGTLVLTSLLSIAVASSGAAQSGNELRPDLMAAVESDASSAADAPLAGRLAGLLGSKVRN